MKVNAQITPNHNPKYTILFDHCRFFEYFDLIKVLVFRKKKKLIKLTHLGNTKVNISNTRFLKFLLKEKICLNLYIEVGWNRTNSDFSIDLQSTVFPLDYYLLK